MNQDCCVPLPVLGVDGGMTGNRLLMQLQADILCIPVGKNFKELLWVLEPVLVLSETVTSDLWPVHHHR